MIYHIEEPDLEAIFDLVSELYSRIEEVPRYREERGYEKLCGTLTQAQQDTYYPSLLDKATYLLISINKGHFFSNGNKRLAITVAIVFLALNLCDMRQTSKEWYQELLSNLFPEYQGWEDFADFTATDFATYHLSIIIAESGTYAIPHDTLKERVHAFFEKSTEMVEA